jgi:hypothetical protein
MREIATFPSERAGLWDKLDALVSIRFPMGGEESSREPTAFTACA